MTNKEVWQDYKEYTEGVTSVARKLGFAGIAIIWVIIGKKSIFLYPMNYALLSIVMFFIFDLLQFIAGALMIKKWIRKQEIKNWEKPGTIEVQYNKPTYLDHPSFILFLLKIGALFFGYVLIGLYLF